MKVLIPLLGLAVLVPACAGVLQTLTPWRSGISDDEIGLSKVDILGTPSPDPVLDDASQPGERPRSPRVYEGAPPVIPHTVAGLVPIGLEANSCIACHAVAERVQGGATPIPKSHYTDLRNAPSEVRRDVVGARYVCTACHAPRTGAPPLVENRFRSG